MALQKGMVSSNTNEWATPSDFFKELDSEFHFTLDPCSTHENCKCDKHYTLADDGLIQDWSDEVVFMNPPYGGNTSGWIKKALLESKKGATVVCLIVSATGCSYWHDFIFPYAAQIRFVRGRLKFNNVDTTAPFASAVIVFTSKIQYPDRIRYYDRVHEYGGEQTDNSVAVPQKGASSSDTDEWETSIGFFNELNNEFSFTLDPCATWSSIIIVTI